MQSRLVVLTGASGGGKTTLARAFEATRPDNTDVIFFDSVGVPSAEAMRAFGEGHQPGGAWQRAMTIRWMMKIAEFLRSGRSVLFEGQMRIAFVLGAFALAGISNARVILVDCNDTTRTTRLSKDRGQPELANAEMMGWATYLREEATLARCEILDTGDTGIEECVARLTFYLDDDRRGR